MPNWVKNKLFIHGPSDMVKQCTLDIASEDEHISFEKILPKPKDIGDGWYDWCIENWSTKWDVNETYEDENGYICFDTAWSTPHAIILELSIRYPELIFEVQYADENLGSNCGKYKFQNADEIEFTAAYGIEEACDIWGYDFSEMYPEIYRDRQIDKIIGDE